MIENNLITIILYICSMLIGMTLATIFWLNQLMKIINMNITSLKNQKEVFETMLYESDKK